MRAVAIIWLLAVVAALGTFLYVNSIINEAVVQYQAQESQEARR